MFRSLICPLLELAGFARLVTHQKLHAVLQPRVARLGGGAEDGLAAANAVDPRLGLGGLLLGQIVDRRRGGLLQLRTELLRSASAAASLAITSAMFASDKSYEIIINGYRRRNMSERGRPMSPRGFARFGGGDPLSPYAPHRTRGCGTDRARARAPGGPAATPALNPDARMLVERASDMPGRCGRVCRRHVYDLTDLGFPPAASSPGDENSDKMA